MTTQESTHGAVQTTEKPDWGAWVRSRGATVRRAGLAILAVALVALAASALAATETGRTVLLVAGVPVGVATVAAVPLVVVRSVVAALERRQ